MSGLAEVRRAVAGA